MRESPSQAQSAQLDITPSFHYEADDVDVKSHDLPGLKARFLLDQLPDGGVVLEVGCGGGKMLRTIAKHRPRAVLLGCDVNVPSRADMGFEFQQLDRDRVQLPYPDRSVDIALLFDVLEHVREPGRVVAEIARVVRPGGLLIAFVPAEGEPISWFSLFRFALGHDLYAVTKDHIQAFRHSEIEDMIGQHFHIEKRQYAYHPLGQLMDALFFASLRIPKINRLYWTQSPFHASGDRPRSLVGRCFGGVLVAANAVAWAESRLLSRVRVGSTGILLTARPLSPVEAA